MEYQRGILLRIPFYILKRSGLDSYDDEEDLVLFNRKQQVEFIMESVVKDGTTVSFTANQVQASQPQRFMLAA